MSAATSSNGGPPQPAATEETTSQAAESSLDTTRPQPPLPQQGTPAAIKRPQSYVPPIGFCLKLLVAPSGYFFVETEGGERWLLDSGCGVSFGDIPFVPQNGDGGQSYEVKEGYCNTSVKTVKKYIDFDFVGLLGLDIIGQFDLLVNVQEEHVRFMPPKAFKPCGGCIHDCKTYILPLKKICCGHYALECTIESKKLHLVVDTGACLTFLQPSLFTKEERQMPCSHHDFHVSFGNFSTFVADRNIVFSPEYSCVSKCGVVPEVLQACLSEAGIEGIAGNDMFLERSMIISLQNESLYIDGKM